MGAQCCINKFNFSSAHLASAPALWLCNKANICRVLLLRGSLSWRMIADAAVTQRGQMTGPIRRPYVRGTPHSLSDRSLSLICPQLLCSLNLWNSVCGFSALNLHIFSFFFFCRIIIYFLVKKKQQIHICKIIIRICERHSQKTEGILNRSHVKSKGGGPFWPTRSF